MLKILLLGDYSGCHTTLAEGLRKLGHDVTVVSDGCSFMQIAPDVMLSRREGLVGGATYLARVLMQLPRWRGYDVVQFVNPHFLSLRPGKLRWLFREIRRHNRHLSVTLCSEDTAFADALLNSDLFRFSEARVGDVPTEFYRNNPRFFEDWLLPESADYQREFYAGCDSMVAVLPEYAMASERRYPGKVFGGGIAIDLRKHPFTPLEIRGKVKVFLGYKSGLMQKKGADILLGVLRELAAELPDRMELVEVHDLPFDDYLRAMRGSHIVVDQLYAYSPATNALNAMAMGKVVATGCEPEYLEWVRGTVDDVPIIPLRPTDADLKSTFREFILAPERLRGMGIAGRRLVEKNNEMTVVARKYVEAWKNSGLTC
ncbi:MAG: hypothetical protein K2M07_01545 [Muribaculaceae bacterium]|nr:hypothetical protein [Muribaculaceae bacterium]